MEESKVTTTEVAVVKERNPIVDNLAALTKPDNLQKYILGTKKDGNPRAVYDVIKDYTIPKKKKKKKKKKCKHKDEITSYSLYLDTKKGKKKNKKNKKYWHI